MTDAITLLTEDHRRADALFDRFEEATDPEAKRDVVGEITRELAVHAAIEEQFLYPTIASALPDGDALARDAVGEHQEVKEHLAALDRADPRASDYDVRVRRLIRDTRHHVEEEEGQLFPRLQAAVDEQRLAALGSAMAAAKLLAPRRAHPRAPNTPPGIVLAGPLAAVVDTLRNQAPAGSFPDRLLDALSLGSDTALQALQTWVETAGNYVPGLPARDVPGEPADAGELVDQAFEVAQRLLDAQRQLAHELLDRDDS